MQRSIYAARSADLLTLSRRGNGRHDDRRGVSAILRFFALLLLVAQFGMVAHRIEHYIEPSHMESGEDSCTAFAPTTGAADLPLFIPPVFAVIFFLRFWSVRGSIVREPADRLGFRAHAPPV